MPKPVLTTVRRFQSNVLAGFCLLLLGIMPATGQSLTGSQIFERMLRVYRTATTYQDEGRVTADFYDPGKAKPTRTTVRQFQTAYYRPTRQLRFHCKTKKERRSSLLDEMFIWTEGNKVYSWWTITDSTTQEESLSSALWVATGVSGTSSRKIPGLLLTAETDAGWGIDSLTNVKLIGNAVQDGRPCYRLSGVYWKNRVGFLWVDQQSFVLLRIDEGVKIPKQTVKVSLTYRPVLNKPVPVVTFTPPDTR